MSVLILVEHENQKLKPSVAQLVSAAQCWKQTVHVLLVGNDLAAAAQDAAAITGVASVMSRLRIYNTRSPKTSPTLLQAWAATIQ
jgi:electron transfer flavoprotein alpha subunit